MNVVENRTKQDGQNLPLAHTNLVVILLFAIKELVKCIWKPRACATSITSCARSDLNCSLKYLVFANYRFSMSPSENADSNDICEAESK